MIIQATFCLQSEDVEALRAIGDVTKVGYIEIEKLVNGTLQYSGWPTVSRSLAHRAELLEVLELISEAPASDEPPERHQIAELAAHALTSMKGRDQETLSTDALASIRELAIALLSPTSGGQDFGARLHELLDLEAKDDTSKRARRALLARIPEFVLFSDDERTLKSSYNLRDIEQNPDLIPSALLKSLRSCADRFEGTGKIAGLHRCSRIN